MIRLVIPALPAVSALYMPSCATPSVRPTMPREQASVQEFWEKPVEPRVAAPFIRRLHQKIADGQRLED